MGMDYKTVMVVGVKLNARTVTNGSKTKYNSETGEPYDVPINGTEWVTESGSVYRNPMLDMTDEEVDAWINPKFGDLCYVGREARTHAVGLMVAAHDPRHDGVDEIDVMALAPLIYKAKAELENIGINDPAKLLILAEVS